MSDLKENWKKTGVGLGHAFRDLGKTLIKTAAAGVEKASDWANSDDKKKPEPEAQQTAADEAKPAEPVETKE